VEENEFNTQIIDIGQKQGHNFMNVPLEVEVTANCRVSDEKQLSGLHCVAECFPKVYFCCRFCIILLAY